MNDAQPSWLELCQDFAAREGIPSEIVEILGAVRSPDPRGGPPPPPEPNLARDFATLEATCLGDTPFDRIARSLEGEVDAGQAQLFGRRLASVDAALAELGDSSGRVLRIGLRVRLDAMLAAPGPRALRLRALADFYYSELGRYLHRQAGGPALAELLADLSWSPLAPGLEHARLDGPSELGPLHINLLRADPSCVGFEALDCRPSLERGLDFGAHTHALGAVAAVSGGFFLYSEPDIEAPSARYDPVGLLLTRGELCSPPVFRRASVLVDERGKVEIERVGPGALTLEIQGHPFAGADAITRAHARVGPPSPSVAIVGAHVVAIGGSLPVPLNGFVLPVRGIGGIATGARVRYAPLSSPASGARLRCGIAGGPMLLDAGRPVLDMRGEDFWGSAPPVTFSQDETGDRNSLPRLAAGLDTRGRLVLAAVDGRNFERALGMTLAELGELMRRLGCVRATNLDGGSSKRMVVRGRTLDLSTTEIRAGEEPDASPDTARVRPVHTALLLFAGPAPNNPTRA